MAGTVIGGSIVVEGEISGDDDLVVHGTVRGRIACGGNVAIDPSGAVEAEVHASHVAIAGRIEGDVVAAEKVEIWPGGRAVGDLKAPRILISDGAVFRGNVDTDA
jgi:cytoskeletal protein CcmA (bactofilin family)